MVGKCKPPFVSLHLNEQAFLTFNLASQRTCTNRVSPSHRSLTPIQLVNSVLSPKPSQATCLNNVRTCRF